MGKDLMKNMGKSAGINFYEPNKEEKFGRFTHPANGPTEVKPEIPEFETEVKEEKITIKPKNGAIGTISEGNRDISRQTKFWCPSKNNRDRFEKDYRNNRYEPQLDVLDMAERHGCKEIRIKNRD